MKCPFCACDDDKVLETRTVDDGARLKRRRECLVCGRRFITNEYVDEITVKVSDGRMKIEGRGLVMRSCGNMTLRISGDIFSVTTAEGMKNG